MKKFAVAVLLSLVILGSGCDKGEKLDNQLPETILSLEKINLMGDDRLNSIVELHWYGTDKDGYVTGYEFSFDNVNWEATTKQDSIFQFTIPAGSDTTDIDFYVRAIDNENAKDASPAYLSIPLKNTPPQVAFLDDFMPSDSVWSVLSATWAATDPDGNATIDSVLIRVNDGAWYNLRKSATFLSIIPNDFTATGPTSGTVYYGSNDPQTAPIEGILLNDINYLSIKVVDIAGSTSIIDSSLAIFWKPKTSDLLVIGASNENPTAFYQNNITSVYSGGYDFINFAQLQGKYQPQNWTPTFQLLLNLYDKLIFYADESVKSNQNLLVIESASPAIQSFVDGGGKALISCSFPANFSKTSSVFQTLPMDSMPVSNPPAQAFLSLDSLVVGQVAGYPNLKPSAFILGLDPFYPTADATIIYKAQLQKSNGWVGPSTVGAIRKNGQGKVNQVFLTTELHKLNGDQTAMSQFFSQILNTDFNW